VAYEAYSPGDIEALLAVFSPDLEWTYLDPSVENPGPQVCRGLPEMRRALRRQADQGLKVKVEEIHVIGSEVVAVLHIPGLDQLRARNANDRNYEVFSFKDDRIVALRACVDRAEALRVAGIALAASLAMFGAACSSTCDPVFYSPNPAARKARNPSPR
jgi:ketosteroid isomerase-like protein